MGRDRGQRWGMPADRREPLGARLALLLVLLNIFLWLGFRFVDILIVSAVGSLLALTGLILARRAEQRIRKYRGRIAGEQMAAISYWGNLLFLCGNLMLMCYFLGTGILSGELF